MRSRRPARGGLISWAFRRCARACSLGARPTRAAVWFFSQSVRGRVFLFIAYDTGRHGFGACAVRRRSRRRRGRLQTATARRELLDSGADGSPKSWRALADDLRRDGLILGLIRHARPLDALPLHAAATSFSLAELLGRVEALIVLSSPRVFTRARQRSRVDHIKSRSKASTLPKKDTACSRLHSQKRLLGRLKSRTQLDAALRGVAERASRRAGRPARRGGRAAVQSCGRAADRWTCVGAVSTGPRSRPKLSLQLDRGRCAPLRPAAASTARRC